MEMKYRLNHRTSEIIFTAKLDFKTTENSVYIVDKKVWDLYKDIFQLIDKENIYFFEASETKKTLSEATKIIDWLYQKNINRGGMIWGIGGGITLDISAFAASIYMRGCRLHFVPTTLLAMIDASLGGKTAVNYGKIKNLIGTFYPAEKIFFSLDFLQTLSKKEMNEGWAELIKISLVKPSNLYNEILDSQQIISENIIKIAIGLKMQICEADLEDRSQRQLLNLGHTFAHIIESISDFQISHGQAVAFGIKSAALISLRTRWITPEIAEKILLPFKQFDLTKNIDIKKYLPNFTEELVYKDKKNNRNINLILFNGFQSTFIYPLNKIHLIKKILTEVSDFEI